MNMLILHTGKTTENYLTTGINIFVKRLKKYLSIEQKELAADKIKFSHQPELQKTKEGELQLKHIRDDDLLILLDERGKTFNSKSFAAFIEKKLQSGKRIVFLTGGAYGFSDEVYNRANDKVSLSGMTFSHQLIRLIFAEQLYRAFSIIHHEPYHHE